MQIDRITAAQALTIRQVVLWPDQPAEFSQVSEDDTALHIGGFTESTLVCVASLFTTQTGARLRKFATLPAYQRRGIGAAVLQRILTEAQQRGETRIWLDARHNALPLYRRFGFEVEGQAFEKNGLSYVRMVRLS